MAATRLQRAARQAGALQEPLLTTVDGTILDGHARWQVAIDGEQSTLPCFVYDVTDDEALQVVIQRHRRSEGLNAPRDRSPADGHCPLGSSRLTRSPAPSDRSPSKASR